MMSLNELANEIAAIHKAANTIEVKGVQNMSIVMGICERCEHLIEGLKNVAEEIQNGTKNDEKEGDVNGDDGTGSS